MQRIGGEKGEPGRGKFEDLDTCRSAFCWGRNVVSPVLGCWG